VVVVSNASSGLERGMPHDRTFAPRARRKQQYTRPKFTEARSARLVLGRLRILLLAEDLPNHGWWVMDYFPLTSTTDHDLLMVLQQMQREGYGARYLIKSDLSPAAFSPRGARDAEAIAAMKRLGGRGLAISNKIIGNGIPRLISWADGGPHPNRRRR
jgi:hypothetical protein